MSRNMNQSQPNMRVPRTVTTNDIQWYLDENKRLIMAIFENMKLRKLDNCAQYQEQLQKNLMYLAALADWQHSQSQVMPLQQMRMQPEYCMQHPQVAAIDEQPRISPLNMALQFANPQEQLHQQVALRGGCIGNGRNPMYGESGFGGGKNAASTSTASPNDACEGSLQAPSHGGDGQGNNSVLLHNHNNITSFRLRK
ncbi:GRF1-interacting factor 3-like [Vigna angularis]|uniref:GRF1-interacting factor 3-like n=1 Tax=Phaseolus angularis TaxID=3914 RepID=UPI00080A3DA1|nr:GRF1-interacting factor 3-like [Vigna angularis]